MERRILRFIILLANGFGEGLPAAEPERAKQTAALVENVARALSYPPENLIVTEDKLTVTIWDGPVQVKVRALITSADNSFIPLRIMAGAMEDILSPVWLRDLAAEAVPGSIPKATPGVSRFRMPGGGIVYAAGKIPDTDGSVTLVWVAFPDRGACVALQWTAFSDAPLDLTRAPEAYRRQFAKGNSPEQAAAVYHAVAEAALNAVQWPVKAPGSGTGEDAGPGGVEEPAALPALPTGRRAAPADFPPLWPWLAAGALLLVLLIAALKKRKHMR